MEGFYQKKTFLLTEGSASYETFYADIYEDLYKPRQFSVMDIDILCMKTKCNVKKNIILDIGCGTGQNMSILEQRGYTKVIGIDNSSEMVQYTRQKYPHFKIIHADVIEDPLLFEKNIFSHILCTRFTIYEIKFKYIFFDHCFIWLAPGGYLLLHIVEPDLYDMAVPKSKMDSAIPKTLESKNRIMKTNIEFSGFQFFNEFEKKNEEYIQHETFIDKKTEHVRQNERTLFMDKKEVLLDMATKSGFKIQEKITPYSDTHQFLIILVKPFCGDN
jgi:SAM-dependent methyltransferase